ncbi:Sip1-related alpha-galactosidase [Paenibacillus hodogayensis]|uniref:Sip1-related alpha-galactosidase n=1 Tax=Paenibacillus hodogayensis TaxID=279208 RepID=A0ABV5VPD0_9BACL
MFVFDQETSSIRFDGDPSIVLRSIRIRAELAGEGEIELLPIRTDPHHTEDGNGRGALSSEFRIRYGDKHGTLFASLLLERRGKFLSVRVKAEIPNATAYHAQRTFAADGAIRIGIGRLDGLQGVLASSRHKEWWTRPHFDPDLRRLPPRTQSLLWKTDSGYGYMLPLCDERFRTDLSGSEDGLAVLVSPGETGHERIDTVAFVLGADTDPYRLAEESAVEGFASRGAGGSAREGKAYPALLDYAGWCSWDAFYADVDEQGLLDKADELNRLGLPVRWFMIDDGWSDVRERKLYGFGADKEKFPGGLAGAVRRLKEEHGIRWVGAWHNMAGYWGGIDPEGEAFAETRQYVHRTRSGRWLPHPDPGLNFGFWQTWHSSLRRQGIDFVKVDNQSSLYAYFGGEQSIARIAHSAHAGLEASVALHFDGCMINCMGMASENVWHRPLSSVSRSSNDFLPKIHDGFKEHALQNAYNSVYHGAFYWGDWDMFWTGHHDAMPHMTLRAVSGGPLYFSDGLGRTNPDIIRPLIYSDGKIVRCRTIGRPTEEWLTVNPHKTARAFKVWNQAGEAGVVAAFHAYDGDEDVEGCIGPGDVPYLSGKAFIAYDSFRKKAYRLRTDETVPLRLSRFEAALFLIVPATRPFTAIGLTDKLVASDAVLETEHGGSAVKVLLKDGGVFSFVSERKPTQAFVDELPAAVEEADGEVGLYTVVCPVKTSEAAKDNPVTMVTEVRIEF